MVSNNNYCDFVYRTLENNNIYADTKCKKRPYDEFYNGDKLFVIGHMCYLWEKREIFVGRLICEIPVNTKIKLIKRVFDW